MAKIQACSAAIKFCSSNKLRISCNYLLIIVIASGTLLEFGQQNSGADAFVLLELPLYKQVLRNIHKRQEESKLTHLNSQSVTRAARNTSPAIAEMNMVRN